MPGKLPKDREKKSPNADCARRAAARRATREWIRYIAGQLKTIYEEAVAEPIPDRLLQLLDRLDRGGKS